jgi:hypothetical protein
MSMLDYGSTPRSATWGYLANSVVIAITIIVCLLAGELMVRFAMSNVVLFPRYHTSAVYGDYTLRRLRPNTTFWHTSPDGSWQFRTNAQGFRDDTDYSHDKSPDVLRVLMLGDSHTQGFEARQGQTYAEVLERYLRAHGVRAQTLNTGISGFGTAEQLVFLENEGIRYDPDVIVVGFYANDYEDSVNSGLFALRDGALVEVSRSYAPATGVLDVINSVPLLRWLSENSYLYSVALNTLWRQAKRALASAAEAELKAEYAVPSAELTNYKKTLLERLLERLHATSKEIGARLIIVDIPVHSVWATGTEVAVEDIDRVESFASSVPPDMEPVFRANSDGFISSEAVLAEYRGLIPLHLPHGHRHMSEVSHTLFAMAIAREIMRGRAGGEAGKPGETDGTGAPQPSAGAQSGSKASL